ncbi:MAG: hypothetical protein R6V47_05150 [Candidatus Delongbacteria bacterium]
MGKKIKLSLKNRISGLKLALIMVSGLLLYSCHSEYLSLSYSIHHGPCISPDSSRIVFGLSRKAYRKATGIARFPDGGIPDYLLEEVGVYLLEREDQQILELSDLSDMAFVIGASRSSWKLDINLNDSVVYYRAQPVSEWSLYKKMTGPDSNKIDILKRKYNTAYSYNLKNNELKEHSDHEIIQKQDNRFDINVLAGEIAQLPLSEIGFVLKEIYPKSDEEYIDETIYLKNNSRLTRRAVIEQIISKMSKDEIAGLLKKMDDFKESLDGLEKQRYEFRSKDIYERIKALL